MTQSLKYFYIKIVSYVIDYNNYLELYDLLSVSLLAYNHINPIAREGGGWISPTFLFFEFLKNGCMY